MIFSAVATRILLVATAAAGSPDDPASPVIDVASDRFRTSPLALFTAGVLLIAALYFLIRMLEWDLVNKETEDQEDPLLK